MSKSPWKNDQPNPESNEPTRKQILLEALDVQMQMGKHLEGRNGLVSSKAIAFLIGYSTLQLARDDQSTALEIVKLINDDAIDIINTWFNDRGKKADAPQTK